MDNFDDWDESIVSKPNRRRKLAPKVHSTIVGPPPPTGVHKESRKQRDRFLKRTIEEEMKKSPRN